MFSVCSASTREWKKKQWMQLWDAVCCLHRTADLKSCFLVIYRLKLVTTFFLKAVTFHDSKRSESRKSVLVVSFVATTEKSITKEFIKFCWRAFKPGVFSGQWKSEQTESKEVMITLKKTVLFHQTVLLLTIVRPNVLFIIYWMLMYLWKRSCSTLGGGLGELTEVQLCVFSLPLFVSTAVIFSVTAPCKDSFSFNFFLQPSFDA